MQGKELVYTTKDGVEIKSHSQVDGNIKMDKTKSGYRLPTEIEWEFAARGGHPNEPEWNYLYAGVTGNAEDVNDRKEIDKYMWHQFNSKVYGNPRTHKPKEKLPTNDKRGDGYAKIYDMCGNVSEWVWDRVGAITSTTPIDGNTKGDKRMLKGFYCYNFPTLGDPKEVTECIITNRKWSLGISKLSKEAGFRIVCR